MGKKEFTALSDLDHTLRYANSMAIIKSITPVLKRKRLVSLDLEITDHSTFLNFEVKIQLPTDFLSGFIDVCKIGYIILLQEFKIVKNDGVVYGVVQDEEEIKLYDENGSWVKWHSEERKPLLAGIATSTLNVLLKVKGDRFGSKNLNTDSTSVTRTSRSKIVNSPVVNKSLEDSKQTRKFSGSVPNDNVENKQKSKERNVQNKELMTNESYSLANKKDAHSVLNVSLLQKSTLGDLPRLSRSRSTTSLAKSTEHIKSGEVQIGKVHSRQTKSLELSKHLSTSLPDVNRENKKSSTGSKLTEPLSISTVDISSPRKGSLRNYSLNKGLTSQAKMSKPSNNLKINSSLKNVSSNSNLNESKPFLRHKFLNSSDSSISSESRSSSVASLPKQNLNESNSNKTLQSNKNQSPSPERNVSRSKQSGKSLSNSPDKMTPKVSNAVSLAFVYKETTRLSSSNRDINFKERQSPPGGSLKADTQPNNKANKTSTVTKSPKNQLVSETSPKLSKNKNDKAENCLKRENSIDTPAEKRRKLSPKDSTLSLSLSYHKSPKRSTSNKKENGCKQPSIKLKEDENTNCTKNQKEDETKLKLFKKAMTSSSSPSLPEFKAIEKQTRRSFKINNESSKPEEKKGVGMCKQYLREFTREINLKRLSELPETTLDDIEEISVPERCSLECKVISKFSFIEDDIEVIRVVDGSLCTKPMLILPQCPTWSDLVRSVIDNTIVEKNLPFVDIIILNASRLDIPLVINNFYKLKNLNLVKFLLHHNSRPKEKTFANEMFCFGEGQNVYPQRRNASRQEMEKQLLSKEFVEAWEKMMKDGIVDPGKQAVNDLIVSSPTTNDKWDGETNKLSNAKKEKKRKLSNDEQLESASVFKKSKSKVSTTKKNEAAEEFNQEIQNRICDSGNSQFLTNVSFLSDETMVENTPPLAKELMQILREESIEVLSESANEFEHLKPSGSELTFSQFCQGVDPLKNKVQTSTQATELDEKELKEKPDSSDDISKMDPLIYSPSSSSRSSQLPTPSNQILDTCSVLKPTTTKQKQTEPLKEADSIRCASKKQGSVNKLEEVIVETSSSSPSIIIDDIEMVKTLHCDSLAQRLKQTNDKQTNDPDYCCILSDKDSSVELLLAEEAMSITSTVENQQSSVDVNNHVLVKMENSNTRIKISEEEFIKHLSKNCFIESKPLDKILANICKANKKHLPRTGPLLPFDDTIELKQRNCVTTSVKIVSIKPFSLLTWKEEAIKGKCPDCKQLYAAVDSITTQSKAALSIGSHLVCPNSECSHQILENPEFHFTLELKLSRDQTKKTAYIGQHYAETLFGCTAQEALNSVHKSSRILEILKKIKNMIENENCVKVNLTREDIMDPESGPLFVQQIYF